MKLLRILLVSIPLLPTWACGPSGSKAPNSDNAAQRETSVDPNDILFSTPTLNDALPSAQQQSIVLPETLQMHEDNWRQFEFVSAEHKAAVYAELADIDTVWEQSSVPLGESGAAFRRVHVRKRVRRPLNLPMTKDEFEALVGVNAQTLTFYGYDEVLRDVHAAKIDNLTIYARIQDDAATTIGFDVRERFRAPRDFLQRLSQFVESHELMLVHWPSRTLFETRSEILSYFGADKPTTE